MTAPVLGMSVSGTGVQDVWADAAHGFPADRLDAFLLWAADRGASDIAFQTGSPAFVEIDGNLQRATAASLDRETVEAVVKAADYGIAVFSTAHTIGVAATVRRMLAEFTARERAERGAALIDAMTLVVTQVLLPNPAGGRTALREWLAFDAGLKAALLEIPQAAWPARIGAALADTRPNPGADHSAVRASRGRSPAAGVGADRFIAEAGYERSGEPAHVGGCMIEIRAWTH